MMVGSKPALLGSGVIVVEESGLTVLDAYASNLVFAMSSEIVVSGAPSPVLVADDDLFPDTDDEAVKTVKDQSGNANDATQSVQAQKPVWDLAEACLEFDQVDDFLDLTNPISDNNFTVMAWLKVPTGSTGNRVIVDNRDGINEGWLLWLQPTEKPIAERQWIGTVGCSDNFGEYLGTSGGDLRPSKRSSF